MDASILSESASPLTVSQLCRLLEVVKPAALPDAPITGVTTLAEAQEGQASFLIRAKLRDQAVQSQASVILVPAKMDDGADPRFLPLPDVWAGVLILLHHFHPEPAPRDFVHPTAVVAPSATLGEGVTVGPYCVIKDNVRIGDRVRLESHCVIGEESLIGDDCVLNPRVTLGHGTRLGRRVRIHSGTVTGADGFKYEMVGGRFTKIPQVGSVVIEDDVEIGANCTIDRASFSETRIGARTKIDNLVHIAHNVTIGSDCVIVAQVGIAGSARIGRGVILAGQVGIADNALIGDGVKMAAQTGFPGGEAPPMSQWGGTPAMDIALWRKMAVIERKLPGLWGKIRTLVEKKSEG
ncbi:MAG: UDP-3-O-(3-hydroxymyristoyl)glucosamine N-acyltransferase [Sumerlaeia bacterium]